MNSVEKVHVDHIKLYELYDRRNEIQTIDKLEIWSGMGQRQWTMADIILNMICNYYHVRVAIFERSVVAAPPDDFEELWFNFFNIVSYHHTNGRLKTYPYKPPLLIHFVKW